MAEKPAPQLRAETWKMTFLLRQFISIIYSFIYLFNLSLVSTTAFYTSKLALLDIKFIISLISRKLVNEEGGFDAVCRERRWTKISVKMGFAPGKAIGSHLRAHYERILYPYNLFQTGANLPVRTLTCFLFTE